MRLSTLEFSSESWWQVGLKARGCGLRRSSPTPELLAGKSVLWPRRQLESGLPSKEIANSSFSLGAGCNSIFRNLLFRSNHRGLVRFISIDLRNSCCESSQIVRLAA